MKKDLQNNRISLCGLLFLFFFSFTVCDVNAQYDAGQGSSTIVYDGTKYNLDQYFGQLNFMPDADAINVYSAAIDNANSLLNANTDDRDYNVLLIKKDMYQMMVDRLSEGNSTTNALKALAFSTEAIYNNRWNSNMNATAPNPLSVFQEVAELAAQ